MASSAFRCGHVALIGRPNVGKSTLINALTGYKVSIVAHKPQTTRHRIAGIVTNDDAQIIFLDTPGLHKAEQGAALSRYLNRTARSALTEADVLALVVDAGHWTPEDQAALDTAIQSAIPIVLVINKIDKMTDKGQLLPLITHYATLHTFVAMIPISAERQDGLPQLISALVQCLPVASAQFDDDAVTDRSERFLVAELVREQLIKHLNQELPYATTVEIEEFDRQPTILRIGALIWVERVGQKAIVLGAQGKKIKQIGTMARKAIEHQFDSKVFLGLHVRVREHWSNDEMSLRSLGYGE
jgi:GTP-binding protein Era